MGQESSQGQGQREEGRANANKMGSKRLEKISNPLKWFKTHCSSFLASYLIYIHILAGLRSNISSINAVIVIRKSSARANANKMGSRGLKKNF